MRAMKSIKGELKRRQPIFAKYEVKHIYGYHKLYKQGIVTELLPQLFLIRDEVELVKELIFNLENGIRR